METSTHQGDEPQELNVDSAAAILQERASKRETAEPEKVEDVVIEDVIDDDEVQETEATQEPDEVEQVEEDAPNEEAATFETIAELAEAADIPIDEFMESIKLTTKVNGEESEVTLAELKKGYQLEADYTRKNQAFIEQQKEFNEQQEQARTEVADQLRRAGAAFQVAQSQLTNDFNSINWTELQQADPTQYVIQRQQFGERQAHINQMIDQASREAQSFQDKQRLEADQAKESVMREQAELLSKAMPAWSDSKVREAETAQVAEYFASMGFQPEEVNGITDHRIILMAIKAMNAVKSSDIDIAKKKVEKVPKLVKSNARQNQNLGKEKTLSKLKSRIKQTGNVDDVAALLQARRA